MDGLKREEPDKETLKRIFEDLEFRSLLDRVVGTDKKTAAPPPSAQGDLFGFFTPESTEAPENSNLTRLDDLAFGHRRFSVWIRRPPEPTRYVPNWWE